MKNKKLIALLLIAAMVLGGVVGVMAEVSPIAQIIRSYATKAGSYCECCFYNQMPNPSDVAALNAAIPGLKLTANMTLGECFDKIITRKVMTNGSEKMSIADGFRTVYAHTLENCTQQQRETIIKIIGTDNPQEMTDRQLENLLVFYYCSEDAKKAIFYDGALLFADCGEDCINCAARECDCCKPDIIEMLNSLRSLLSRLFTLFNYLNTGRIEFLN